MDDIPDEVDVLVVGTGLTESIVAAACARVDKVVLHLDDRDYYGSQWASFSFDGLLNWAESAQRSAGDVPAAVNDRRVDWKQPFETISNIEVVSYVPAAAAETSENQSDVEWTLDKLKASSRKFNIDLCPRVSELRDGELDKRQQAITLVCRATMSHDNGLLRSLSRRRSFTLADRWLTCWFNRTYVDISNLNASLNCSRTSRRATAAVTLWKYRVREPISLTANRYRLCRNECL